MVDSPQLKWFTSWNQWNVFGCYVDSQKKHLGSIGIVGNGGGIGQLYKTLARAEVEKFNQFYNELHTLVTGRSGLSLDFSADWKRIQTD
jgi:hypothetical protein